MEMGKLRCAWLSLSQWERIAKYMVFFHFKRIKENLTPKAAGRKEQIQKCTCFPSFLKPRSNSIFPGPAPKQHQQQQHGILFKKVVGVPQTRKWWFPSPQQSSALQTLFNADITSILRTSKWNSLCSVMKCENSNREVLHFCCAVLKWMLIK